MHPHRIPLLAGALLAVLLMFAGTANAEVGGTPANPPWLVSVFYDVNGAGYMCSGSIIAPNVVLTAAHCADGTSVSSYYIIDNRGGDPEWRAAAVIADPGYDPSANALNDVALIQLKTDTGITPMPLATTEAPIGASALSYGWGFNAWANGTWAGRPGEGGYVAPYTIVPCDQSGFDTAPSQGCVFGGDTYALAPGDSGGPVVINGVEYGLNDETGGLGYDGVFTQVADVQPWLGQTLAAIPAPPQNAFVAARKHYRRYRITLRDLLHLGAW